MNTPYPSIKAALGAAASISRALDLPASALAERVQSVPDGDGLDRPISVRAALTRAGLEPDGDDALLLYRWATTDDSRDEWDDAVELAADSEYAEAIRVGQAGRARLAQLLELLGPVLIEAGVVRRPPKLALYRLGWRVVEDGDGRRSVQVVVDPSPLDSTVYTGPDGEREAKRVAAGAVEGHVVAQTVIVSGVKHPDLAAEFVPRWEAGEFEVLLDLDEAIAVAKHWSTRRAQQVRATWGIRGSRGGAPTRPRCHVEPCATLHRPSDSGTVQP
jgi:hypothetical protein